MTEKIESIDKQPLRGMRDFLPQHWLFRTQLLRAWEQAAERHGFVRYETPIVEPLSLLERKAGEEISDQIYHFEDKSGRSIALRPELTPSMVRIVSGNREAFTAQGKVYSIGQCFRYERASLGRKREHFQWNIDIVGEEQPVAEAYLLKTAVEALNTLGFGASDFQIHVNNRELVCDFLIANGISVDRLLPVMGIMDKKEKVSAEAFGDMLSETGLSQTQIQALQAFMSAKTIAEVEAFHLTDSSGLKNLKEFLSYADTLGISDYITVDMSVVRGLAYYTGIVFEAFDTQRAFRAIFGGGRYDHLFERLTGKPLAAVGLGFGDVVIEELFKTRFPSTQLFPDIDILAGVSDRAYLTDLLALSTVLSDMSVDCDFKPSNLKKFLGRADKRRARIAAYIGEIEHQSGCVLLKNMTTGAQQTVALAKTDLESVLGKI